MEWSEKSEVVTNSRSTATGLPDAELVEDD
jgi:hypothetical protein